MKQFLLNIYNEFEKNKYKVLILTLLFLFFVLLRNFIEIINSSWFIFDNFFSLRGFFSTFSFLVLHWLFWYIMFFFIIFSVLRYIVKIEVKNILYFSLVSVVLLLPIFISVFLNHDLNLKYLNFHDMSSAFRSLGSLFLLDKFNFVVFSEMLCLFIGFPIINYIISKNILRSVLAPFFVFIIAAIFGSFVYICPSDICLINISSDLKNSYFVFYWIPLSFLSFSFFIFPELKKFILNVKFFNLNKILNGLFLYIIILSFLIIKLNNFFDIILVSISYLISYISIVFSLENIKLKKYFDALLFLIIYGILIALSILLLIIKLLFFN